MSKSLPLLFKGTKTEETSCNFNYFYPFQSQNYFYLQIRWVLTPWWDASSQFSAWIPSCEAVEAPPPPQVRGEAPPPPQGMRAQQLSLPHYKGKRPSVKTQLALQCISKFQM